MGRETQNQEIFICSWKVTATFCSQEGDSERHERQGAGSRPQHAVPGGGSGDVQPSGHPGVREATVGTRVALLTRMPPDF